MFVIGLGLMLLPNMVLLPVAFIALIGLVKSLVRAVGWYEFRGRDMQRKSAAFAFVWLCVAVLTMPFAGGYAPVPLLVIVMCLMPTLLGTELAALLNQFGPY